MHAPDRDLGNAPQAIGNTQEVCTPELSASSAVPKVPLPQGAVSIAPEDLAVFLDLPEGMQVMDGCISVCDSWRSDHPASNCYAAPPPRLPDPLADVVAVASGSWDRHEGVRFTWLDRDCDRRDAFSTVLLDVAQMELSDSWADLTSSEKESLKLAAAWIVDLPEEPSGVNRPAVKGYLDAAVAHAKFKECTQPNDE